MRKILGLYSAQAFWKEAPLNDLHKIRVDIRAAIEDISRRVDDGQYPKTLDVDHALTDAFGSLYDGHTTYTTRCSSAFFFLHDYPLVSVASTSDAIPEIYLGDPATGAPRAGARVISINNQDPNDHLQALAKESPQANWIDLDARYNNLFIQRVSVAQAISPVDNIGIFAGRYRMPQEPLNITLNNGSHIGVKWKAIFNWFSLEYEAPPMRLPFNSSRSFKAYGMNPAFNDSIEQPSTFGVPMKTRAEAGGDNTLFWQSAHQGVAIGALPYNAASYYNIDHTTGVVRIPAFSASYLDSGKNPKEYISDIANFIHEALHYFTRAQKKRVLIDISRNTGGDISAGYAVFRQFFPQADPFYGQDMRNSPTLKTLIQQLSSPSGRRSSPLDYHYARQVDGVDFSTLGDFIGPTHKYNDSFTRMFRVNDSAFIATDEKYHVPPPNVSPFAAKNIALLSNSLCGSTCAFFAEAMQDQGVRSVVYGGRPGRQSLQVSGGTKGGVYYSHGSFVYDSESVDSKMSSDLLAVPPPYSSSLGVNLVNTYSRSEDQLPLEFQYHEATHAIQLTAKMAGSAEERWQVAAQKIWG